MRRLDFVVTGLPRGGTTAVARYLSAVPNIHCGIEVFPTWLDHASLAVPDAFLAHDDPHWHAGSVEEVARRGDRIRWWGNKTPTYFYRLPTLLAELGNAPCIVCLRDLRAVAASYDRRAANPKDESWHAGRVGLFALGDALLLLHALRACPEEARVLLIPQTALLADWRAAMTRAVAHVAPGAAADFDPARLQPILAGRGRAGRPADLHAAPRGLARLERDGVAAIFAEPELRPLATARAAIEAALAKAPPSPIHFVQRRLDATGSPAARAFFEIWARHAGRACRLFGMKGPALRPLAAGINPSGRSPEGGTR